MVWRGRNNALDRFWSCLVYLLPLMEALQYSNPFFAMFPAAQFILFPLLPFFGIYNAISRAIPFGGLVIFFALFLLVVRNHRILHFIRFNTMQALLIGIALSIVGLVWSLLPARAIPALITEVVFNTLFLGGAIAVIYAIVQTIRGLYAEIPVVSEAAYVQTRH